MNDKRGYSLIELLVTIGLIAVLASLIIGGVNVAKLKSKDVHCGNNLRTIGLSIVDAAEETGKYPKIAESGLGEYLSQSRGFNPEVLRCKLDKAALDSIPQNTNFYSSYSYNSVLSGKLLGKNPEGENQIASDNQPRHNGGKNAVTTDLRVIRIPSS